MTIKQYNFAVKEAANYPNRDAYISDLVQSSVWGDAQDVVAPPSRIDNLGEIYDACHRDFKQIAAAAGLSCRKLAMIYCVPARTAEAWAMGTRGMSLYLSLCLQRCLGLLTVHVDA